MRNEKRERVVRRPPRASLPKWCRTERVKLKGAAQGQLTILELRSREGGREGRAIITKEELKDFPVSELQQFGEGGETDTGTGVVAV